MRKFRIFTLIAVILVLLQSASALEPEIFHSQKELNTSCEDSENILIKLRSDKTDANKFLQKFKKTKLLKAKKLFKSSPKIINTRNKTVTNRINKLQLLKLHYGIDRIFKISTQDLTCTEKKSLLQELNHDSDIEYAEFDHIIKINSTVNDPFYQSTGQNWTLPYDELWALKQIQADKAWDISQGEDVVVAVLDTGVDYNHPDLWNNIWVNPNLINDRNSDGKINLDDIDLNSNKYIDAGEISSELIGRDFYNVDDDPLDESGHGTHVAGIIAAEANNQIGVAGIAPKAKILPIQVLGKNGLGTVSSFSEGLMYLIDLYSRNLHIKNLITNNSYGGRGSDQTMSDTFQLAKDMGIVNIASAGNDSDDSKNYIPASLDSVITVAATTYNKTKSNFSNYGELVDLAAPGGGDDAIENQGNILSTLSLNSEIIDSRPTLKISSTDSSEYAYARFAGTSMAGPHVAGVTALIKSIYPEFNFDDIKNILTNSVDDINEYDLFKPIGNGIINAFKAVSIKHRLPNILLDQALAEELSGIVNINGMAIVYSATNKIANANFEYSLDGQTWSQSNVEVKENKFSIKFDTTVVNKSPADIFLRLTVTDLDGLSSKILFKRKVDNLTILNLFQNDIFNSYDQIPIQAIFPYNAVSTDLLYKKVKSSEWLNTAVTKSADLTKKFASIDATQLEADQVYAVKLVSRLKAGVIIESSEKLFYIDSKLKKGFPYHSYKDLSSNLDLYKPVEAVDLMAADINGDGKKEIIKLALINNKSEIPRQAIEVLNYQGEKLWVSQSFDAISDFITLDIDKDGDEEIFFVANMIFQRSYIFGLNGEGKSLPGWPLETSYKGLSIKAVDIDGDANKEIIFSSINRDLDHTQLQILDPKTASIKASYTLDGAYDNKADNLICNIDDDSALELIYLKGTATRIKLAAINLNDGTTVIGWQPTLFDDGNFSVADNISFMSAGDIDNDGHDEIVTGLFEIIERYESASSVSYLFHRKTAILDHLGKLKGGTLIDKDSPYGSYVIANIDEDANKEILYVYKPPGLAKPILPVLTVLNYDSGTITSQSKSLVSQTEPQLDTYSKGCTLVDVNEDGKLEVLISESGFDQKNFQENDLSTSGGIFAIDLDAVPIDLSSRTDTKVLVSGSSIGGPLIGLDYAFPLITDLDANGKIDILVLKEFITDFEQANSSNRFEAYIPRSTVYAWELNTKLDSSPSPTHRRDTQLTSHYTESEANSTPIPKPPSTNIAPLAKFNSSNSIINSSAVFNAYDSYDPDGTISQYAWDWDNDNITDDYGQSIEHKFLDAGNFTIKLTVKDNAGAEDSIKKTIQIKKVNESQNPTFSFYSQNVEDSITNASLDSRKAKSETLAVKITKTSINNHKGLKLKIEIDPEFTNIINLVSSSSNSINIPVFNERGILLKFKLAKNSYKLLSEKHQGTTINIPIRFMDMQSGYSVERFIQVQLIDYL